MRSGIPLTTFTTLLLTDSEGLSKVEVKDMNELRIIGTQKFMGIEIPIVEGGFGEDCRISFDKTIADIHGVSPSEIRKSINRLIKKRQIERKC